MNHNESTAVKQSFSVSQTEILSRDLRQAIKVVNAEYQQIDWEDQAFLNRVLNDALENLESNGGGLCRS
jgi:hypothetical protein